MRPSDHLLWESPHVQAHTHTHILVLFHTIHSAFHTWPQLAHGSGCRSVARLFLLLDGIMAQLTPSQRRQSPPPKLHGSCAGPVVHSRAWSLLSVSSTQIQERQGLGYAQFPGEARPSAWGAAQNGMWHQCQQHKHPLTEWQSHQQDASPGNQELAALLWHYCGTIVALCPETDVSYFTHKSPVAPISAALLWHYSTSRKS